MTILDTKEFITAFVQSYLATASWITTDSGDCTDFTRNAKKWAKEDCLKFIQVVRIKLGEDKAMQLLTIPGKDLTYLAPHDFWLTRNEHGAGFWDKEDKYGKNEAAVLTEICKEIGGCDCYHLKGPRSKLTF